MARKRQERKNTGLFDVPDERHDGDDGAGNGGVEMFGGPTRDSGLFGVCGHYSGLFDAPARALGDMPGLFRRLGRATGNERAPFTKPRDGSGKSVGLFDKPRGGGST